MKNLCIYVANIEKYITRNIHRVSYTNVIVCVGKRALFCTDKLASAES